VIFDPPAPPIARTRSPFLSVIIVGHIEDIGRFPGSIKLAGEDGIPYLFITFGEEKSFIWLLKMIPVLGDMNPHPKLNETQT